MSGGDRPIKPFPERKRAFAEREVAKGKGLFAGSAPRGEGPLNRHGMPQLPVGQRRVPNWPVLDLGDLPTIAQADWRLQVDGLVGAGAIELTWERFMALPQVEEESDFHCVTTWSRMDMRFGGVRFRDVVAAAGGAPAEATHVFVTAYDEDPSSGEPYTTNLPLDEAIEPDVLLVHSWEGKPLREHGGPCRMVTPQLYAWKGAKWIRRITLRDDDEPGFWERRGYSDTAYPWFDDRYSRRR